MLEKGPLVSVIVPAYNVEEYIEKGIESVLNQTYSQIELVIVDDGSTDDTLDIIRKYAASDDRVIYSTQKNSGVSTARNEALKMAKGQYVLFLDSDDWLETDTVEYLINLLKENERYLISADCYFAYLNEDGTIRKDRHRENAEIKKIDRLTALKNTGTGVYNQQSSCYKLYCKQIIDEHNLAFEKNLSHGEDGLFVFKYLHFVEGLVYSTYPCWNILERPNSATTAPYNKKWLTAIDAIDMMLEYSKDNKDIEENLKIFHVQRAITVMMSCLRSPSGDKESKKYLRRRLKENRKIYIKGDITFHDKMVYMALIWLPFWILKRIV